MATPSEMSRLARQAGVATLPLSAFECEVATGTVKLANQAQQLAYLTTIASRMECIGSQVSRTMLQAHGRYQHMVQASMLRLARSTVAPPQVEQLALASLNSVRVDAAGHDVERLIDIACILAPEDMLLLRIYEGMFRREAMCDREERGYRLGAEAHRQRFSEGEAQRALERLQKSGLLAPGTDIALDPMRTYLSPCEPTQLGHLMVRLLQEPRRLEPSASQ